MTGTTASADRPNADAATPLLSVNNIEVVYSDVILVLRGLSLQVPEGQIVALLGANGAGKSTTLKAISGLLKTEDGEITRGSITFGGQVISGTDPELGEVQGRVALAILEGERVFMMIGIGPEETWSQEDFEQVRESLDITAAAAPAETTE